MTPCAALCSLDVLIIIAIVIIRSVEKPGFPDPQIRFRVFTVFRTPDFLPLSFTVSPPFAPPLHSVLPLSPRCVCASLSLVKSLFPFRSLIWQRSGVYIGYRAPISTFVDKRPEKLAISTKHIYEFNYRTIEFNRLQNQSGNFTTNYNN